MAVPTSDLFDLIKTMTPAERGQFVVSSQIKVKDPKYKQFFVYLCNLGGYDEEKIISECLKKKICTNFSYDKHHLNKLLLDFLTRSEVKNQPLGKNYESLIRLHLFFRRGLYGLFTRHLKKIKNRLYKEEEFSLLLDLLQLEREVESTGSGYRKMVSADGLELIKEKQEVIRILDAESRMEFLAKKAFVKFSMEMTARTEDDSRELKEILEEAEKYKVNTFNSHLQYCNIQAYYNQYISNAAEATTWFEKGTVLWDNYPAKKEMFPEKYLVRINNLICNLHTLKKYDNIGHYISQVKNIHVINEASVRKRFLLIVNLELIYLGNVEMLNKESYANFLSSFEEEIARLKRVEPTKAMMDTYFNFGMMSFLMNDRENAIKYLFKIDEKMASTDVLIMSKIFLYLINFEDNADEKVTDHYFSAALYQIRKNIDAYTLENELLYLLKNIIRKPSPDKVQSALRKMLKLCQDALDSNGGHLTGIEELSIWIQGKLENKTTFEVYAELYQAKVKNEK